MKAGSISTKRTQYVVTFSIVYSLSQTELLRLFADAAGIELSTVRQILRGEIRWPADRRVRARDSETRHS